MTTTTTRDTLRATLTEQGAPEPLVDCFADVIEHARSVLADIRAEVDRIERDLDQDDYALGSLRIIESVASASGTIGTRWARLVALAGHAEALCTASSRIAGGAS